MNLKQLFETQEVLDNRIIKQHNLDGVDLLPNIILALQVELSELCNEWQGFKHWKVNPQSKPHVLEEYVDCLHFILSIGNKIGYEGYVINIFYKQADIIQQFLIINYVVAQFMFDIKHYDFQELLEYFFGLGEMLGFDSQQIIQAYLDKNKVNHQRQDNGY